MHAKMSFVLRSTSLMMAIFALPPLATLGADGAPTASNRKTIVSLNSSAKSKTGAQPLKAHSKMKIETPIFDTSLMDEELTPFVLDPVLLNGRVEKKDLRTSSDESSRHIARMDASSDATRLNSNANRLAGQVSHTWFRIPSWIVGTWKTTDKTLVADINYRTGRQARQHRLQFGYCGEIFGYQQDKNGTYWQYKQLGMAASNVHTDRKGRLNFNVVSSHEPITSSDTELVLRKTWRNITTYPDTQEIVSVKNCESTLIFKRTSDGTIVITEKIMTRDHQGQAISYRIVETAKQRVAPYQQVDQQGENDLRNSFGDFLTAHGSGKLSPRALAKGPTVQAGLSKLSAASPARLAPATSIMTAQASKVKSNDKFEVDIDLDHL